MIFKLGMIILQIQKLQVLFSEMLIEMTYTYIPIFPLC